jgi:hypothetical protein
MPSLPIHSLSKLGHADPAQAGKGGKGEYDFIIVRLIHPLAQSALVGRLLHEQRASRFRLSPAGGGGASSCGRAWSRPP